VESPDIKTRGKKRGNRRKREDEKKKKNILQKSFDHKRGAGKKRWVGDSEV